MLQDIRDGIKPTLATMREMIREDLTAAVLADKTDRDLLIMANNGSETINDQPETAIRDDKQIESRVETIRDVESGEVIKTVEALWTYYEDEPGAPVDTITIIETDGEGNETRHDVIKHYIDGRQPVLNPPDEVEPIVIEPLPIKR